VDEARDSRALPAHSQCNRDRPVESYELIRPQRSDESRQLRFEHEHQEIAARASALVASVAAVYAGKKRLPQILRNEVLDRFDSVPLYCGKSVIARQRFVQEGGYLFQQLRTCRPGHLVHSVI
jgi:hypothetical protein